MGCIANGNSTGTVLDGTHKDCDLDDNNEDCFVHPIRKIWYFGLPPQQPWQGFQHLSSP
jgi:hypothetical protein